MRELDYTHSFMMLVRCRGGATPFPDEHPAFLQGVKFVFDKIDPQRPEKEYSFRVSPRSQCELKLLQVSGHQAMCLCYIIRFVPSIFHMHIFLKVIALSHQSSIVILMSRTLMNWRRIWI